MNDYNIKFNGLEELINKMNVDRPTMNILEIKDKKTQMLEKIKENTKDINDSNKNQFWKSLLTSVIGGTIGGVISYLLTLL